MHMLVLGATLRFGILDRNQNITVTWFEDGLIMQKYILHCERNVYLMYLHVNVE